MVEDSGVKALCRFLAVITIGLFSTFCSEGQTPEFKPEPQKAHVPVKSGGARLENFEVGTGSGSGEATVAVRQALEGALKEKTRMNPDFLMIHPTAGSDCNQILQEARRIVGEETRIYGGTSDARGVFSNRGYVTGTKGGYGAAKEGIEAGHHGLVAMTISTPDIVFGVGSASLADHGSAREIGAEAVRAAIEDAGKKPGEKPSLVLVTPTIGIEQQVLDGIGQVVGTDVILLGGTAGGPDGVVIGNDAVYAEGVSLAVFYTDLAMGWAFESGFEKTDEHSGVVTRMDGRRIVEIDDQPAYEVYDGWLDGEVTRLRLKGEKTDAFRDFLSLHPLFRKRFAPDGNTYTVFSHPWAPNKNLITDGLFPTGNIQEGDRVYLSYGTWEVLMNRIGNLPQEARESIALSGDEPVLLGFGIICGGVMGVIPDEERLKFPVLINHANGYAPFIASFTWGEQGSLPGVGYQHCNLTTSFLVIGPKKT